MNTESRYNIPPYYVCVGKDEIIKRLCSCSCQKDLFRLLAFGKENPDYKELLMKVSFRLHYISTFVYKSKIKFGDDMIYYTAKPDEKDYAYWMFDQYCPEMNMAYLYAESLYKEKGIDNLLTQNTVELIFNRYRAVRKYTLPMLEDTNHRLYPSHFRDVIEYVLEHDDYPDEDVKTNYEYPNFPALTDADYNYNYRDY